MVTEWHFGHMLGSGDNFQLTNSACCLCCLFLLAVFSTAYVRSCDGGNLEAVIVTSRGSLLPRVALFAARDIVQGEELTFSYAISGDGPAAEESSSEVAAAVASRRRCYCGTAACSGFLPKA
jgi:SET domain-containing protein